MEAVLRMNLLLLLLQRLLTNFYLIFKESEYFESYVETSRKCNSIIYFIDFVKIN